MKNIQKPPFSKDLLHPKHWLSWLMAGVMWLLVSCLPYFALMSFGGWLGGVMEKLMAYRLLVARTNIQLCFANRDWQIIYARHVRSLGKGIIEMSMGWLANMDAFHDRVDHQGYEAVDDAKTQGKGVLFLGIHTTNLDFAAPLLSHKYPVSPMYQKAKSPVLDYIIQKARLRHCSAIIDRNNMREVISRLKKGENIWYGCDQDFGDNAKSVFTPFYGVSAYTLPYYAKIAQKTGAVVIPVAGFRDDESGRYVMRYLPAIDVTGMDDEAAALSMNHAIESLLDGYEDQYYWVHRRFKTRPEGEPALYPKKPNDIRREKKRAKAQKKQR